MIARYLRLLPEIFAIAAVCAAHYYLYSWLMHSERMKDLEAYRGRVKVCFMASAVFVWLGIILQMPMFSRALPYSPWQTWTRGLAIAYGISVCMLFGIACGGRLFRRMVPHREPVNPARRTLLKATANAALATPLAVTAFGIIIERQRFVMKEVSIAIPNLPKDLQGLTLVQLTDMHVSPFLSVSELARAVDMANEAKAKIALVTGDLISTKGDPLDGCLRELGRLRAEAGVFGCMGNHEIYAHSEDYTQVEGAKLGMRFLRSQAQELRFGDAVLNLAGIDYQRIGEVYLPTAGELLAKGANTVNVLLSHNPDVFPVAAGQGWDLTLSGHTHGGQVTFELLSRQLNIARFFTPYVQGVYERDGKSIFVSRGLGTVGVPARIGAPPEVALIKLCAT